MLRRDGKVREIWGHQFRIVRDGLDEAEVFAFVGRLIEQNSELSGRLEHVDSLKRLAENAVIEAAKQAERIELETREEANEKAKEIIIQAQDETKAAAARIIAEAEKGSLDRIAAAEQMAQYMLKAAEEKAKAQAEKIIADAEEKVRARAEEQTEAEVERIIAEAQNSALDRIAAAEQLAHDMLEAAEEKAKAQAAKIITEAEQKFRAEAESIIAEAKPRAEELAQEKLSVAEQEAKDMLRAAKEKAEEIKRLGKEEASRIVVEAIGRVEEEAVFVRREAEQPLPISEEIAESEIREIAKRVLQEFLSNSKDTETTTTRSTKQEVRAPRPSRTEAAVRAAAHTVSEELQEQTWLGQEEGEETESHALYRGTVEVAILPPVAMSKLLKVHRRLTRTRQVNVLDVAGSAGRGVIIRLFLRSPMPLIEMLQEVPEVDRVAPATKQTDKTYPPQHQPGQPAAARILVTIKR